MCSGWSTTRPPGTGRAGTSAASSEVDERRATDIPPGDPHGPGIVSAFPPAPSHTVRAVLPHTAFPRAVDDQHSALPERWSTIQAIRVPDRSSLELPRVGDRSPSSPLTLELQPHTRLQVLH